MPEPKSKRKQYLVNPGFQWKVAGTIAVAVFLFSILISVTLYGTLHQQARLRVANPSGYTAEVTSVMITFGLGFAAITAGGVGLWSILMTHRICGPMHVMKRYLTEMADGKIPSLRPLRKRDEFKDLYDTLDKAVTALRVGKQRELMQISAALDAALRLKAEHATNTAVVPIIERLESLRALAQAALTVPPPDREQEYAVAVPAAQAVQAG